MLMMDIIMIIISEDNMLFIHMSLSQMQLSKTQYLICFHSFKINIGEVDVICLKITIKITI